MTPDPLPATGAVSGVLTPALRAELVALYGQVPATACASSGECCALTDAEYAGTFATMFPVYRVEYLNLVDHVRQSFPALEGERLLQFTEERPRRCPFLSAANRCTAYAARPLICRTYGVLDRAAIDAAAQNLRGDRPAAWVDGFVRRESGMTCPRVRVLEPAKVARHVANLVDFVYERELTRLSQDLELADPERHALFARVSGDQAWPVRWTWGGFNAVRHAPLEWLRDQFDAYWEQAWLIDLG